MRCQVREHEYEINLMHTRFDRKLKIGRPMLIEIISQLMLKMGWYVGGMDGN